VARPAPTARPDARRLPTRLAKAARDTGGAVVGGAKAAKGAGGAVVGGAKVAGVAVGHAGIAAGRAAVGAGKTIASASGTVRSAIRPRRRGEAEGNAAMIRRGYRAIAKGDFVSLKGLVADDAVWHVPGRSELAADYTGPEEIAKMFLGLGERSGGTLRIDLHDVTASHDHVVALQRVRATRDGLTLDAKQVVVFHIHAGRISEAWGPVSTTQHEDDGFWGAKTRR
jgi:ketosteroid isomerase-like protein